MYDIELRKVFSNNNALRDDLVKGVTRDFPVVGKKFIMFGEGKDYGVRYISTNIIKKLEKLGKTYRFETFSGSIYEVEVLGESRKEQ